MRLGFTVKAFGSFLVEDQELYLKHKWSMHSITVSMLMNELTFFNVWQSQYNINYKQTVSLCGFNESRLDRR